MAVEQFYNLNLGQNRATIDLSKVRKQGLINNRGVFGKKPKIEIYYIDRPTEPEINIEFSNQEEAELTFKKITKKLDEWAAESNAKKIQFLEEEIKLLEQQKEQLVQQTEILNKAFEQFKEIMQIMDIESDKEKLLNEVKEL